MALTKYQKFVKANKHLKLSNGMVDMKEIGRLWAIEKGGKSTPKAKPKAKPRSVRTTTKKPEKKVRKTAKQKAKSQAIPVSAMEKRSLKLFQRLEQCRLALGMSAADFKWKATKKGWNLKVKGWKGINRVKLSDLVQACEKKTRSRI